MHFLFHCKLIKRMLFLSSWDSSFTNKVNLFDNIKASDEMMIFISFFIIRFLAGRKSLKPPNSWWAVTKLLKSFARLWHHFLQLKVRAWSNFGSSPFFDDGIISSHLFFLEELISIWFLKRISFFELWRYRDDK